MIYFNQNNYPSTPYPSKDKPNGTIKSSGCGVVCACMIVGNLTGKVVEPPIMASYAISKGARVSGGTDMNILARNFCTDYNLSYRVTEDENLLISHLKSGGMVIANVGGNHGSYKGVFSDGGHYVVIIGLTPEGKLMVLDPGYYAGKFNLPGRKGKVTMVGNIAVCDISIMAADTEIRPQEYWLFSKKGGIEDMKLGVEVPEVNVILGNKKVDNSVILTVDGKDTTYIPVKTLELLGMTIGWNAETRTVTVKEA